jgi:hypothetical protein
VKQTRKSVIRMQNRHFTAPVDEISGAVDQVSAGGISLNEYPGRLFQFSSVSTRAADMSARILDENNQVFPSLRNQKTSRARARPKLHVHDPGLASYPGLAKGPGWRWVTNQSIGATLIPSCEVR